MQQVMQHVTHACSFVNAFTLSLSIFKAKAKRHLSTINTHLPVVALTIAV